MNKLDQICYLMHLVSMYNKKWKKKENSVMNFQIPVNLNPVSHCKSSSQCHLKTDKDKAKAISHLSFAELQNGHRFCSLLGYRTLTNMLFVFVLFCSFCFIFLLWFYYKQQKRERKKKQEAK